jgi:GT2 family glycosyltransferase
MLKKVEIGIIVACHNRIKLTSRWLQTLQQSLPINWSLTIIAIDDGSSDGTTEFLMKSPFVTQVVRGDGSWFWAKSMSIAEDILIANFPVDYILWANDDTAYFQNSLEYVDALLDKYPNTILVGQFTDKATKKISYGGMEKLGRHPFRYRMIETSEEGQRCDVFNGNFVLIPTNVQRIIGQIDGDYAHGYADFDYAHRALANHVDIVILHQPLGECSENLVDPSSFATLKQRIQFLRGKKGMPFKSHVRYLKKYGPLEWPIYIVIPYLRAIFGIGPKI